ncbi:MAG: hypothetical protein WDW21_02870 [Neisseriaceae bacterium]
MATVMERDVLIEAAVYTGEVIRSSEVNKELAEKLALQAGQLWQKYLYSEAKDLDFEKEVQILKSMRAPYETK